LTRDGGIKEIILRRRISQSKKQSFSQKQVINIFILKGVSMTKMTEEEIIKATKERVAEMRSRHEQWVNDYRQECEQKKAESQYKQQEHARELQKQRECARKMEKKEPTTVKTRWTKSDIKREQEITQKRIESAKKQQEAIQKWRASVEKSPKKTQYIDAREELIEDIKYRYREIICFRGDKNTGNIKKLNKILTGCRKISSSIVSLFQHIFRKSGEFDFNETPNKKSTTDVPRKEYVVFQDIWPDITVIAFITKENVSFTGLAYDSGRVLRDFFLPEYMTPMKIIYRPEHIYGVPDPDDTGMYGLNGFTVANTSDALRYRTSDDLRYRISNDFPYRTSHDPIRYTLRRSNAYFDPDPYAYSPSKAERRKIEQMDWTLSNSRFKPTEYLLAIRENLDESFQYDNKHDYLDVENILGAVEKIGCY
jgi:hypothetical protein